LTEVLFYHLTDTPLEHTLPTLLEKSLGRGWHVRIRTKTSGRCDFLDSHLWSYGQETFLPHGTSEQSHASAQPILITTTAENSNSAQLLMLVDGAEETISSFSDYDRVCVFFDGNNPDEVAKARDDWKEVKSAEFDAKYWAQDDGRWVQRG